MKIIKIDKDELKFIFIIVFAVGVLAGTVLEKVLDAMDEVDVPEQVVECPE